MRYQPSMFKPATEEVGKVEIMPYKGTVRSRAIDAVAEWVIYQNGFRFWAREPESGDVAMHLSDRYGDAKLTIENL